MRVSYKNLWNLLIDKDMNRKDLQSVADVSWTTITRISKNEKVGMNMLTKICAALYCKFGDIMDILPDETGAENDQEARYGLS